MHHSTYSDSRQAMLMSSSNNLSNGNGSSHSHSHSHNNKNKSSVQSQTLNFHRIRNKISGNKKHRSSSSGGAPHPGSAFSTPKSAPLPRKMYAASSNHGGSSNNISHSHFMISSRSRENLFASSQDMRFLPPEVKNSNCSVYNPVSYTHLTLPTIYSV